jgi:hypothetical protein
MSDERKVKSYGRAFTRDGFSQGTGQLIGRDKDAQKRKEKRIKELQAEGISEGDPPVLPAGRSFDSFDTLICSCPRSRWQETFRR